MFPSTPQEHGATVVAEVIDEIPQLDESQKLKLLRQCFEDGHDISWPQDPIQNIVSTHIRVFFFTDD